MAKQSKPSDRSFFLLGSGGHATVVAEAATSLGWDILGAFGPADSSSKLPSSICALGGDEILLKRSPVDQYLLNGIGMVTAASLRRAIFDKFASFGFEFPTLIHPTAFVSGSSILGDGVQVMAHAVVQSNARLGDNVLVNTSGIVEHDCEINAHVHIASGAIVCGGARVGIGSLIGAGSVVLQGVTIGSYSVIGAGSVILRDIKDGSTVVGNPGRIIKGVE